MASQGAPEGNAEDAVQPLRAGHVLLLVQRLRGGGWLVDVSG